jgi:hypothetical protein
MRGLPRRLKTAPAKSYLIFHAASKMPAPDTISRVPVQQYYPRRVHNIVRGCKPRRQITRATPLPMKTDHPVGHNHAALGRRSFLKKRTKRLLFFWCNPRLMAYGLNFPQAHEQKSFGSFLQKRTFFLLNALIFPDFHSNRRSENILHGRSRAFYLRRDALNGYRFVPSKGAPP